MRDWSVIWAFISTILALAVGWGFTQASAWLTLRESDKRVRREVLYFLLELYQQLISLQSLDKAGRILVDTLLSSLGEGAEETDEQSRNQLADLYQSILRAKATPLFLERLAELKEGYQDCLCKLATVDPLNASLLRGQESVLSRIDHILSSSQFPELADADPYYMAKLRKFLEDKLIAKTIPLLTGVIKELAEAVGGHTKQKLSQTLDKRTKFDAEVEKTYRVMLAELPAIIRTL